MPNIGATNKSNFLTPDAKKAFNYLWLAFIKAPILQYFDIESHIRIKTDVSGYVMGRVLTQLNLDSDAPLNDLKDLNSNKSDFDQWHAIVYFFRKMISIKTQYKTKDAELLAIVKGFKIWRHHLKGCKYKVFVSTNHNNLQ